MIKETKSYTNPTPNSHSHNTDSTRVLYTCLSPATYCCSAHSSEFNYTSRFIHNYPIFSLSFSNLFLFFSSYHFFLHPSTSLLISLLQPNISMSCLRSPFHLPSTVSITFSFFLTISSLSFPPPLFFPFLSPCHSFLSPFSHFSLPLHSSLHTHTNIKTTS